LYGGELVRAPAAMAAAMPKVAPRVDLAWMLDPVPVLRGATSTTFARDLPRLAFAVAPPVEPALSAPVAVVAEAPAAKPELRGMEAAETTVVPLPVARPSNLLASAVAPAPARVAGRQAMPRTRDVFRAAIPEEPSFFDRLFGGGSSPQAGSGQALAYANPDAVATPRPRLGPAPSVSPGGGVAVYDISASTVTLPSGEVLEAHSGYGDLMDDPRYVHVRMRGATPPGTYDMTERESLFHGVRAIRLTPIGGSGAIHGRDGILAHTYMLRRQPGASNGCVVFRDYERFLRAFLRGDVRRLIVVAGNRGGRMDLAGR
jgi:hypothetical protein